MIEGTQSSLSDLLLFELDQEPGVPLDDVREVGNCVAALDHGLRLLEKGLPLVAAADQGDSRRATNQGPGQQPDSG